MPTITGYLIPADGDQPRAVTLDTDEAWSAITTMLATDTYDRVAVTPQVDAIVGGMSAVDGSPDNHAASTAAMILGFHESGEHQLRGPVLFLGSEPDDLDDEWSDLPQLAVLALSMAV